MNNLFSRSASLLGVCLAFFIALSVNGQELAAEERIEAHRSALHLGQSVLACGRVAQVSARNEVTYVNLDNPYPRQTLGLVIWRRDLPSYQARFGALPSLVGKSVCARGVIEQYRSNLQLVLRNPQSLNIMTSQASDIKISAWYIAGLRQAGVPGGVLRSQANIDRLAHYASRLNATVVALQSVDGSGAAVPVFGSGYVYHFTAGQGPRSGFALKRGIGFVVNPDLPLLPPASATSAPTSTKAADITLTEGGAGLRLLSVEFEPRCSEADEGDVGPACERLASNFRQVAAWVRERERTGEPFIILGNFNRTMRDGRDDLSQALAGTVPLSRANAGFGSPCWMRQELGPRPFQDHLYLGGRAREWFASGSMSVMAYAEPWSSMMQLSPRCPVSIQLRLPTSSP